MLRGTASTSSAAEHHGTWPGSPTTVERRPATGTTTACQHTVSHSGAPDQFPICAQTSLASARVERAHSMFQLRFPTSPVHDTHMYPQTCGASGKLHIGPCTKHTTYCALMQGLSNQQQLAGAMAHVNLGCPGDAVRPVGLSQLAHPTQPRLSSTTRDVACKQVRACMRRQVHVQHAMLSKLHHKHSSNRHNTSCTAGEMCVWESVCLRVCHSCL
jgi:hypothetical protein